MSTQNGDKYLTVEKGTKLEDLSLPSTVDSDILTLSPFRTRLEIKPGEEHSTLDSADILKQLEENGYAIHGAKNVITLKLS